MGFLVPQLFGAWFPNLSSFQYSSSSLSKKCYENVDRFEFDFYARCVFVVSKGTFLMQGRVAGVQLTTIYK